MIQSRHLPSKRLSERARKICFYLILVDFFLTLSNKRNKVSGGHDWPSQLGEGRVGARPGGGGGAWIKNCMGGLLFPYGGIFFYVCRMCIHSLHVGDIFFYMGGGVSFSTWVGGGVGIFELAPITIFGGALCCHIFYCTDIFNFSRSWRFEFLKELSFSFLGGRAQESRRGC